jgi:hypothetical protein
VTEKKKPASRGEVRKPTTPARGVDAMAAQEFDRNATIVALMNLAAPLTNEMRIALAQFLAGRIKSSNKTGPRKLLHPTLGVVLPEGPITRAAHRRLHVEIAAQNARALHDASGIAWPEAIERVVADENAQWASFVGFEITESAVDAQLFPRRRRST